MLFHKFSAELITFVTLLISSLNANLDVSSLQTLIHNEIEKAKIYTFPKDNGEFFQNLDSKHINKGYGTYDFIIVGAGSAGAVIANRLSEIQSFKILLLDAGDVENEFTDIPGMMFWSTVSEKNWGYYSTPQTTCCLGMKHKQCFYPRGKSIGGTSTINGLMYVRGNKQDYDLWGKLTTSNWSYKNLLPFFKKSENFTIDLKTSKYHGHHGPMTVSYTKPESQLYKTFHDAATELNLEEVDYNAEKQIGFSRTQLNILNGKRVSSGRAFLDKVEIRNNLKVITNALVTKIIVNSSTKTAEGVFFTKDNMIFRALASKEVILSAGAINTPQLLMLSGIGPKNHLKQHHIKNIVDLPVGSTLRDHVGYFGLNFRTNVSEPTQTLQEEILSYLRGEGDLTVPNNDRAVAFINTRQTGEVPPNIELMLIPPTTVPLPQPSAVTTNFNNNSYLSKIQPLTDFQIGVILLHPKSKGTVTLRTSNPKDFPLINLNFFSDPDDQDIETLYEGIQYVLKLVNTEAFRQINATLTANIKECELEKNGSKEYWYCALRHLGVSMFHTMGTAPMGDVKKNAVVNENLEVHGVKQLRIADCSVIPVTISGHTHAAAVMIGEKLADILKIKYTE